MAVEYIIGEGVRAAMAARGDEPRSHETYEHDLAAGDVLYSVTQGRDAIYRWTPEDGVKVRAFAAPQGEVEVQVEDVAVQAARWKVVGGLRVPVVVDRVALIRNGFSPRSEWPRESFDHLVVHSLEGFLAGAIAHWNTGVAGAHIVICRNGDIVLCCPLDLVAWHAGTSATTGIATRGVDFRRLNINPHSVGVELEGFAQRLAPDGEFFTDAQFRSLVRFGVWYRDTLGWKPDAKHTWRHSEISNQRGDPGKFPVEQFLEAVQATR